MVAWMVRSAEQTLGRFILASVFVDSTRPSPGNEHDRNASGSLAVPQLLSCLVLSWSEPRSQLLHDVAADESWHAEVCDDVRQFLRCVFQSEIPLAVVDLPPRGTEAYDSLIGVTARTCELNRTLVLVCGAENDAAEEQWARQLGVWAYLPGVTDMGGLKTVLAEARQALARQSMVRVELTGCR